MKWLAVCGKEQSKLSMILEWLTEVACSIILLDHYLMYTSFKVPSVCVSDYVKHINQSVSLFTASEN